MDRKKGCNFTKILKYESLSRYILLANCQSINPKFISLLRRSYLIHSFYRCSYFFKETSELVPYIVMEKLYEFISPKKP